MLAYVLIYKRVCRGRILLKHFVISFTFKKKHCSLKYRQNICTYVKQICFGQSLRQLYYRKRVRVSARDFWYLSHRRAANAQTIRCSHTQKVGVNEGSDQTLVS